MIGLGREDPATPSEPISDVESEHGEGVRISLGEGHRHPSVGANEDARSDVDSDSPADDMDASLHSR